MEEKVVKPIVNTKATAPAEPAPAETKEVKAPAEKEGKVTITKDTTNSETGEVTTETESHSLTESEIDLLIPRGHWRSSPMFYEVAKFFGVDESNYDGAVQKLSDITEWAIRSTESNNIDELIPLISKIERRLPPPTWGEKRFNIVHRYVRLLSKQDSLGKAIKAYEKSPEV